MDDFIKFCEEKGVKLLPWQKEYCEFLFKSRILWMSIPDRGGKSFLGKLLREYFGHRDVFLAKWEESAEITDEQWLQDHGIPITHETLNALKQAKYLWDSRPRNTLL